LAPGFFEEDFCFCRFLAFFDFSSSSSLELLLFSLSDESPDEELKHNKIYDESFWQNYREAFSDAFPIM